MTTVEQKQDPFLAPSIERLFALPVHPREEFAKKKCDIHRASFWVPEAIDMSHDFNHFQHKLSPAEQNYIKLILAFFSASDTIVNDNIGEWLLRKAQTFWVKNFYSIQMMFENIHSETYALLLDTLIQDDDEKKKLLRAIETVPTVQQKAEWAMRYIHAPESDADNHDDSNETYCRNLIAFAIVEYIFFQPSFAGIFYFKNKGFLPGASEANEYISRDEGIHVDFAVEYFLKLKDHEKIDVVTMMKEAVDVEKAFNSAALETPILGMNKELMFAYIESMADKFLQQLGLPTLYGTGNPFPWMAAVFIPGKTNFFERRVSEYKGTAPKAKITGSVATATATAPAATATSITSTSPIMTNTIHESFDDDYDD